MRTSTKYQQVKQALKGLDVNYRPHFEGERDITMARVNGYSIIWHEHAYGHDKEGIVEVLGPGVDCEQVEIAKLRELVA